MYPDQEGANLAARQNQLNVLSWLAKQKNIYPNQKGVNMMASRGHSNLLKWLILTINLYPDQDGINYAAMNNQLDILIWIAKEKNKYPNQKGANMATAKGSLEVLRWLYQTRKIYPNEKGMKVAAAFGQIEVLKWLISREIEIPKTLFGKQKPISLNVDIANVAASYGQVDLLKWLAKELNIYPDIFNFVILNGYLKTLKWIHKHKKPNWTSSDAGIAVSGGHLDVVIWFSKKGIYPDGDISIGSNSKNRDRINIIKWLAEQEIYDIRKPFTNTEVLKFYYCIRDQLPEDFFISTGHDFF